MTFSEKLINARHAQNLSQLELAEKTGVSERSIYSYEQAGTSPRTRVLQRLAAALNVSVTYLMDDEEIDKNKNIGEDLFIANSKNEYGYRGAREAQAVVDKASALFAGGELDDAAKEVFFQSLMEVYLESKADARRKYAPKRNEEQKTTPTHSGNGDMGGDGGADH